MFKIVQHAHTSTRDTILFFWISHRTKQERAHLISTLIRRSRCGERIVLARLLFDFMFDVVGMAIISNINCTVRAGEAGEFGPCEVAKMYGHHYPAPCSQNGFSLWLGAVVSLSGLQSPSRRRRRDTNSRGIWSKPTERDGIFIFDRPANYLV